MRNIRIWLPLLSIVAFLIMGLAVTAYKQWPRNIFDELNYETIKIRYGADSHLMDEEFGTREWYDFGQLEGINLNNWDVGISFFLKDELWISVDSFEKTEEEKELRRSVTYIYHISSRKLEGGQPIEYLMDHFLTDYFDYCEDNGIKTRFSKEDLGKFDFELNERWDRTYD